MTEDGGLVGWFLDFPKIMGNHNGICCGIRGVVYAPINDVDIIQFKSSAYSSNCVGDHLSLFCTCKTYPCETFA